MGVWHDLDGDPGIGSARRDEDARWQLVGHGVLNVVSDLVEEDGARLGRAASIAQVRLARHFPVSETTWRILDEHVLRRHPDAILRYGWLLDDYGDVKLTFLDHLPSLRRLSLDGRHVDLTPVRRHGGIVHLGVSDGAVALRPMTQVASVRSLWLGKGARHPLPAEPRTGP
jgi:hypothetical protein